MIFVRFQETKLPLGTRIMMILGSILVLGALFFFAFTFFLVVLVAGVLGLVARLLFGGGKPTGSPLPMRPPHRKNPRNDHDDVIDV